MGKGRGVRIGDDVVDDGAGRGIHGRGRVCLRRTATFNEASTRGRLERVGGLWSFQGRYEVDASGSECWDVQA